MGDVGIIFAILFLYGYCIKRAWKVARLIKREAQNAP
jgi:uncharacterized membrane protein (Fun14 family)